MDTKQKALALSALGWFDFNVKIRENGEWYATCAASVKEGPVLVSTFGSGATPEAAVDDLWKRVTILSPDHYLVLINDGKRSAIKWNGFMWSAVNENLEAA